MALPIDPDNTQAVIKSQFQWLQTLQSLNHRKPIRIKIQEGKVPPGEDPDRYMWLPFVNITTREETKDPTDNDLSIFHFVPDGMIYGANPKKKKQARATIALPSDVCGESVSDLWDWEIKIIAIKRDKLKKAIEEYKQGEPGK